MNGTNDKNYFKKFHENTENSSEIVILRRIFQLGLKPPDFPSHNNACLGYKLMSPWILTSIITNTCIIIYFENCLLIYPKNLHIFLKEATGFCLRSSGLCVLCCRYVRAGTELTWDYNYEVGSVAGKVLYCYCGSSECRGRLL